MKSPSPHSIDWIHALHENELFPLQDRADPSGSDPRSETSKWVNFNFPFRNQPFTSSGVGDEHRLDGTSRS